MNLQLIEQIKHALQDKQHNYFYDKKNNQIIVLSKIASEFKYGDFQACQAVHIERRKDDFLAIEPITVMDEFELMNEFSNECEFSAELNQALEGDNPFMEFDEWITLLQLQNNWNVFFDQKLENLAVKLEKSWEERR
jgi:hypothetical protein